jgi:ethanolamine utilization protein EutM
MQALGFIETKGFVAAVEAADSGLKSASVSLVGYKSVGSGLVTVILTGDVAAVKAAVEAGTGSASAVGKVVATQVIASPHEDMAQIIFDSPIKKDAPVQAAEAEKANPAQKKRTPGV